MRTLRATTTIPIAAHACQRQRGVEEQEDSTSPPRWSWIRLLKRVFAVDMVRCPSCQQGSLRIIAAITQGEVIRKILRHLKLSADPALLPRPVSASKPWPGPPPDRTWRVADLSPTHGRMGATALGSGHAPAAPPHAAGR